MIDLLPVFFAFLILQKAEENINGKTNRRMADRELAEPYCGADICTRLPPVESPHGISGENK